MRQSIIQGKLLPESLEDFHDLRKQGRLTYKVCIHCSESFEDRTQSPAGWRDTQIVGYCERCYDDLFAGEGDEHAPN
jgi:hypothetical protein